MKKEGRVPILMPAVLRILQSGVCTTAELFDVFFSTYGESYRKARQYAYGTKSLRSGRDWGDAYIEVQRFYKLLNYLKQQGLVGKEKKRGERHARWRITLAGRKRILTARKQEPYLAEKDRILRVVVFDVPESEKTKREWLRGALRAMGFSLLQESVWVGARKIPKRFLFDLEERGLLSCVHIFSVYREGSMPVTKE